MHPDGYSGPIAASHCSLRLGAASLSPDCVPEALLFVECLLQLRQGHLTQFFIPAMVPALALQPSKKQEG